jgi:hypothetical protein
MATLRLGVPTGLRRIQIPNVTLMRSIGLPTGIGQAGGVARKVGNYQSS